MQKYIHKLEDFSKIFDKLSYSMDKYWATYSVMMFEIKDSNRIAEFEDFLLKYIRITDTIFSYSKGTILLLLEETTIRWALLLEENLREKIKDKWFKYDYYSSAVQWDYIEKEKKIYKALKKMLKIAKEDNKKECIYNL